VSEEKNEADAVKGRTLEELSVVVQDLVNTILEKRKKLAPQIVDLRTARNNAAVVEQEWEEKKSQYEYHKGMLMAEVNKLETEVNHLTDENRLSESLYHRLNCQLKIVNVQAQRVEDEKEYRAGSKVLDGQIRSYTHLFHSTTETLEQKSKSMQKRRRDIDEHHDYRLQQVEWFTSLKKIMQAKVAALQAGNTPGGPTRMLGPVSDAEMEMYGAAPRRPGGPGADVLTLPAM